MWIQSRARLSRVAGLALVAVASGCLGDVTRPDGTLPPHIPERVDELRLSRDSVQVQVLDETTLTVRALGAGGLDVPDAVVAWRSEDERIAEVNEGRVVGKLPGATRIIAESDSVSAAAIVTVVHRDIVHIDVAPQLVLGHTYHLSPGAVAIDAGGARLPDYPMSFVVSDTSVSDVDAFGRLVGRALGETELAIRAANATVSVPVRVERAFQIIIPSRFHSCALDVAGQAYCWGQSDLGRPRLGSGEVGAVSRTVPYPVAGDLRFRQLALGEDHSCAIALDGTLYCWGAGTFGRLGTGSEEDAAVPTPVLTSVRFELISAGQDHTCAVTGNGAAYCWGRNLPGVLGQDPGTPFVAEPLRLPNQRSYFLSMTTGASTRSCGMPLAGFLYCWGDAGLFEPAEPELCEGQVCYVPVAVQDAPRFGGLTSAYQQACGITFEGWTYCWGANRRAAAALDLRLDVLGPAGMADMLCGLRHGDPYCWNWSHDGARVFQPIGDLELRWIASGWRRACGITTSGFAYCWEDPVNGGQPVDVPRPEDWSVSGAGGVTATPPAGEIR